MDNNNLYPNDGNELGIYYPEPTKPVDTKKSKQKDNAIESFPILQDVISWFDEQIASCSDLDSVYASGFPFVGPKYSLEAQIYGLKRLKELLQEKRNDFVNYRDEVNDVRNKK